MAMLDMIELDEVTTKEQKDLSLNHSSREGLILGITIASCNIFSNFEFNLQISSNENVLFSIIQKL